jgi:hypothetical protein
MTSNNAVIVLDDNDESVAMAHVGATASASAVVIDLCNDDTISPAAHYAATMAAPSRAATAKKRKHTTLRRHSPRKQQKVPTLQTQDAIAIDCCATSSDNNASSPDDVLETAYRQALGPVRMNFCATWKARRSSNSSSITTGGGVCGGQEHTYHASREPVQKAQQRTLYKELLEYKLNLPISSSSSIFVRVQESRLDLLRVLITGMYCKRTYIVLVL